MQSARLQLEVLYLYANTEADNQAEFLLLFRTASRLIMSIKSLHDTTNIASYSPIYLSTSLSLASFTLLRMMKSRFTQTLEESIAEDGKYSLFVGIHILKQMSIANNDVCTKSAEMLSTMWTNQALFKTSDYGILWTLRIRNRLSMSVVFDTILVWIEQYGYCNGGANGKINRRQELNKLGAKYSPQK
jgi:hypothetical protein